MCIVRYLAINTASTIIKTTTMKRIYLFLLPLFLISCDPADIQRVLDTAGQVALTDADISKGLKQALDLGVGESVNYLSATDGFYKSAYKIFLPEEANTVINKLKGIPGFSNVEDELLKLINRGAEDAASKAGPIFYSAIKQITFDDALNILTGPDDAATSYLKGRTQQSLYAEFTPIITASLQKVNAQQYWADIINTYNQIPFIEKKNPDLADHVTSQALVGLASTSHSAATFFKLWQMYNRPFTGNEVDIQRNIGHVKILKH